MISELDSLKQVCIHVPGKLIIPLTHVQELAEANYRAISSEGVAASCQAKLKNSELLLREHADRLTESEARLAESHNEISEFEALMGGMRDDLGESNRQREALREKLSDLDENNVQGSSQSITDRNDFLPIQSKHSRIQRTR